MHTGAPFRFTPGRTAARRQLYAALASAPFDSAGSGYRKPRRT
jgi:hypothetical protein